MPTPFENQEFTFRNADGTEFKVRGWGNQFYAVFETQDGLTIVKDAASGSWRYAKLSPDGTNLVPSTLVVGVDDPRSAGLRLHIRPSRLAAKAQAMRSSMASGRRRWEERLAERKAAALLRPGSAQAPAALPSQSIVGHYVGLCLLIEFPDVHGTIAQDEVDRYCNQVGYANFGNNGSVRDYFFDVSDEKLTYTNVVTTYFRTARGRDYYTDPNAPYGHRAREMIVEALQSLIDQNFDFSALTADGSGYIHALNVFYAGPTVNNWAEGLWPHAWSLASPFNVGANRYLFDYQITSMGSELKLGTFCHENGHMVCSFPDLYDYGYESRGAGNYSLMAFGGGDDRNPVQVDAYLKHAAGWTSSMTSLVPGMNVSIEAGKNDFCVYGRNEYEYFIIENRQRIGRDASLPDSGLLIWHVDETGSNNNEQMTPESHYECSIEQADGNFDLERNANAGDSDDLYAAPVAPTFSDSTVPNSRWWDGIASGFSAEQISASSGVMSFFVGGASSGSVVEVGRTAAVVTDAWHRVGLEGSFDSLPVLVAAMQTYNGSDPASVRIRPAGNTQLDVKIEEEQSKDQEITHIAETLSYLAAQAGPIVNAAGNIVGEAGTIRMDQPDGSSWRRVSLINSFSDPVVIAQVATFAGAQPCHVRLKDVGQQSFELKIEEWDYLDQSHIHEVVSYVVFERGQHILGGDQRVSVDREEIDHEWKVVAFHTSFGSPPSVFSQCQTYNGNQAVVTRQQNVQAGACEIRLQEEEANDDRHVTEDVAFVAFSAGS